jgi:hypothetical protein
MLHYAHGYSANVIDEVDDADNDANDTGANSEAVDSKNVKDSNNP